MNLINKIKSWYRRFKRKRALKNKTAPLREFVYLDDVSVYSLISSRIGPVAVEFTETEKISLQSEANSSINTNIGIAKGEVNSSILSNQTQGSQILRKSIIQTTFKDLYESELENLIISPIAQEINPPKINNVEDLLAESEIENSKWIINSDKLTRGQLLEFEVELEAEEIFHVSTLVSELLDIIREEPKMFGVDPGGELLQVKSVNKMLAKLLVGLIPIKGNAFNYRVVEIDEKKLIVHKDLLTEFSESDLSTFPLYVVGVAEHSLFWKDVRRVLFSNAKFKVMCRITQNSIKKSWTPVKLAHVLEPVIPDIGDQLDYMGSSAFKNMKKNSQKKNGLSFKNKNITKAMIVYAELIADNYDLSLGEDNIKMIKQLSELYYNSFDTVKKRRKAFNHIISYLNANFDFPQESFIIAQYRSKALKNINFNNNTQNKANRYSNTEALESTSEERFLDTEFVAIYW